MSVTTTKTVVLVLIIIWLLTLLRSFLIMICGSKIFKKASKGEKTAYYPVINLFTMLEVADVSSYLGILLFVPVLNIIVLIIMSIKLGKVFNTGAGFTIGLVILPFMFYPLLAISDKQYKITDEAYFKAMDNARGESINLMTEEEIKQVNETIVEEKKVDSIFKSDTDIKAKEVVGPYKATKIDLLGLEKLKASSKEDELLKPIERVEVSSSNNQNNTFVKKEKKDDNIEMMDL